MALFTRKTWKDTVAQYPTRRTLHDVSTGTDTVVTVTRNVGTVSQQGDVWNASNMNNLEGRVGDAFDALDEKLNGYSFEVVDSLPTTGAEGRIYFSKS